MFTPRRSSEAVSALLADSTRIFSCNDIRSSCTANFRSLSKVICSPLFSHLGCRPSDTVPMALRFEKLSRFFENYQNVVGPHESFPFRQALFHLEGSPNLDSQHQILAFSGAPKLSKLCHLLPGILAPLTREIPEELRNQDFEIRQNLHGLLTAHELSIFASTILRENVLLAKAPEAVASQISSANIVQDCGTLPILQSLFLNCLAKAIEIRYKLRDSAVRSIEVKSVRISLRQGHPLLSPRLFDVTATSKAEECLRSLRSPVVVNFPPPSTSSGRCLPSTPNRYSFRGCPRFTGNNGRSFPASSSVPFRQPLRAPGSRPRGATRCGALVRSASRCSLFSGGCFRRNDRQI